MKSYNLFGTEFDFFKVLFMGDGGSQKKFKLNQMRDYQPFFGKLPEN